MDSEATSILRWAGSKRQILGLLASYYSPQHRRYFEPFCGSASLFAHLGPKESFLSDLNAELVNALIMIRDRHSEVSDELHQWHPTVDLYYEIRSLRTEELSGPTRAARFIYLNRLCFNGLYRTNKKGEFNVPWGGLKSGQLPSESLLAAFARRLSCATISCCDFEESLAAVTAGDFVYIDPPYRVSARRTFREYMPGGFGSHDLTRLRATIERLDRLGVTFVLSYADSHEAREIGRGFSVRSASVRRHISRNMDSRAPVSELIITNCP